MSSKFQKGDVLSFLINNRKPPDKRIAKERTTDFTEIYSGNNVQDLQIQADRCLDCGNPYCEFKCPLHNYIPNWLELVTNNEFDEAAELMHLTNPLPEICGRVCPQDRLCEQACTLNTGFGAVTIGAIEKDIADRAITNNWRPDLSKIKPINKSVAIIGAGPAGLGCAELLTRNGIKCIVYDKYPEIGGLLTFGIPSFKLEKQILVKLREYLQDLGIKFILNTEIGKDISIEQLQKDFDCVFLGMGTYNSVDGKLKGINSKGVIQSLDYLIGNINQQQNYAMKNMQYNNLKNKEVIVLGGGDTAMDCVRSAIRQQAKSITCVYRRTLDDMPGSKRETLNAQEEGVKFLFNLQPTEILTKDDQVTGVEFSRTDFEELKHQDQKVILTTDTVIIAFGFQANQVDWFNQANIETKKNGLVITNSQKTTNNKIFAGGDMVTGADLVVTAIAQGRAAAKEIITSFT